MLKWKYKEEVPMTVTERVDARGLVCPMPTIRLGQAIRRVSVGEIVELLSDDPGSEYNMAAWTRNTGHELVHSEKREGVYQFQFRRLQ